MFGFREIRAALADGQVPLDELDIKLPELDVAPRIGVGRGGDRSYALVGPGQATGSSRRGQQFSFEPWKDLVDSGSGAVLKDVCVLRFWPIDDTDEIRQAVAAVFAGLVDLGRTSPTSLGSAIAAMETLFESGLTSRLSREVEIGLAGELLVIAEAKDPSAFVSMWHSAFDAQFDFSAQGERLEVKTTSGAERLHWFSSGQVTPIPGVCTSFVSVLLPRVEIGSTIASVFADLARLTAAERARVRNVIIDVAKEPPEVLTSVVFDRDAARASMLHVAAGAIPTPLSVPGVGKIDWEATIASDPPGPPASCRITPSL
jgi:hypothetical protein